MFSFSTGPASLGIIQTPKSFQLNAEQHVTFGCIQDMKHDSIFWYSQYPWLGLRVIYYSYDAGIIDKTEVSETLPSYRIGLSNICASSYATELYGCLLSV